MSSWARTPNINAVLEAIKKLADKENVIDEPSLYSHLDKEGRKLSPADLSKALLILEALGYISVQLSTKEEKLIKLLKTK
ncbi:MAG: hypothetical protein P3X22_003290 [Thermoprotei archaeon]|nr:hypothetical protein [Thermoprotei archaeon]